MHLIYVCPGCATPVADQPAALWTSAYRPSGGWRHLDDDRPLCTDPSTGRPFQPATTVEETPADDDATDWLTSMRDLFGPAGPYNPARVATATRAAEDLIQWLYAATGPLGASLALPAATDVAHLVGALHRIARTLARVHAQTSTHLQERPQPIGPGQATTPGLGDLRQRARAALQTSALQLASAAQDTGIAWATARTCTPDRAPAAPPASTTRRNQS
jgi:hypothetical protein